MIEPYKKKTITTLKKSATHIQKIIQMIEEDGYCADIMQQTLAVQGYLKSANASVLESHLHTCGAKNLSSNKKGVFIKELIRLFGIANR